MNKKPQLIPDEPIIAVQLSVVKRFGQVPAEILSRLDHWMNSATQFIENEWWVYKTYENFMEELGKSESTINRALFVLEGCGVLISKKFNSWKNHHVKFYRIDYDLFYEIMGIENPRKESDHKEIQISVPVDNSSQNEGIENIQNEGIYSRISNTVKTNVCMGLSTSDFKIEVKEEFWEDEDWPLVKILGDCRIDPDSNFAITIGKITREISASAEQLKEALNVLFNAKFHIRNPFGFIKKVLRDFISGESAYFNYHYGKGSSS